MGLLDSPLVSKPLKFAHKSCGTVTLCITPDRIYIYTNVIYNPRPDGLELCQPGSEDLVSKTCTSEDRSLATVRVSQLCRKYCTLSFKKMGIFHIIIDDRVEKYDAYVNVFSK